MKVLIIPEDFRNDQYILKPLFLRLFHAIGKPRTKVEVCCDPLLGGVDEAMKIQRIEEILMQHSGMTDIFILCIDRDGNKNRRKKLDRLESKLGNSHSFLAENAWEELETWVLAGLTLPGNWRWSEVRVEVQVKELYFEPLVTRRGLSDEPGGGRKTLGEEASRHIGAIRQKCPEDFDALARRLESVIQTH